MATVLYLVHHETLLQNATDIIIKCDSYFITNYEFYHKMRQSFLLQNATFFYKIRKLLQNASILFQNAAVITKCDVYYKMCQYTLFFTLNKSLMFFSCFCLRVKGVFCLLKAFDNTYSKPFWKIAALNSANLIKTTGHNLFTQTSLSNFFPMMLLFYLIIILWCIFSKTIWSLRYFPFYVIV